MDAMDTQSMDGRGRANAARDPAERARIASLAGSAPRGRVARPVHDHGWRDARAIADAIETLGDAGILWDDVDDPVWARTGIAYARHVGCSWRDGADDGAFHYVHRRTDRTHRPEDRILAVWDRTDANATPDVRGLRSRLPASERASVVVSRVVVGGSFVALSSAAWSGVRGIGAHAFVASDPNAAMIRARTRDARVEGYEPHKCPRERRTGSVGVRLTARTLGVAPAPETPSGSRTRRAMARLNDPRMDATTRKRHATDRADDVRRADIARAFRTFDAFGR